MKKEGELTISDEWEDIINFTNGTVNFDNIKSCSFEFIEELCGQIKQSLQERKKKEIPEASTYRGK